MVRTNGLPDDDADLPAFLGHLGVPGIFDVHVHFMPERIQAAVWAHFDALDPPWTITYRLPETSAWRSWPAWG